MGEISFWYRPTRVVPDQRPLNGRCCCCCVAWRNNGHGSIEGFTVSDFMCMCCLRPSVPSVLWRCWLGGRKGIRPVKKTEWWWGAGVVICLERGADLHIAQLMPLPLTVSCFSKIQEPDLQNILRQSYDYLTIMPKLRSTYDGRLVYKTSHEEHKAFLGYG